MHCPRCSLELPSGFPGATITCVCGASTTLESIHHAPPASAGRATGGPYRAAATRAGDALETLCPYCGNGCPALVRTCPHCDVRLDNVRCVRCYTLQAPGSFACARCGQSLELEPMLDATDAPCPRCRMPLEAAATGAWDRASPPMPGRGEDDRVHECPRCGGMFVPRDALAEILCRAELSGSFPIVMPRGLLPLDEVTYVPCPLCHSSMNRVNFGKLSGVIVDVCRDHGTWFDGGELTRVVAFAAAGGLAKTRAREELALKDDASRRASARRDSDLAVRSSGGLGAPLIEERLTLWREFLHAILS